MKKILLIVSLLYVLVPIESFSQASEKQRYYYAYDNKVYLDEVENKLVVCFQPNNADGVKSLIGTEKIESQNNGVCVINEENSARKETLRRDLLQIEGIKSVQPMYRTVIGGTMSGVTDEIVMRFKEGVSQQQIDELHKKYGACVKKITRLYQLVSVSKYADALEIANQYQLSGLVEFSHPNFISKVEKYQAVINDPYFIHQFYLHNTGQLVNGRTTTGRSGYQGAASMEHNKG